ncbi:MAG: glycosyl transferase [Desulfobulbus sp.]
MIHFCRNDTTLISVGKPSLLALQLLNALPDQPSLYDIMDDFPAFYRGISKIAMRQREQRLAKKVNTVLTSSSKLHRQWVQHRPDIQLIANGLDTSVLPPSRPDFVAAPPFVFGYVGTIASWFDWEWVLALSQARPADTIRLIGPNFSDTPLESLPKNVEVRPPCAHQEAIQAMQHFDVGLIPFQQNPLTASVDPIKYYEYRALGKPVLSTSFGEMTHRGSEHGVFLTQQSLDVQQQAQRALAYIPDQNLVKNFIAANTWAARFDTIHIPPERAYGRL